MRLPQLELQPRPERKRIRCLSWYARGSVIEAFLLGMLFAYLVVAVFFLWMTH